MNSAQQENQPRREKRQSPNNSTGNSWARYTGMAVQMIVIIVVMTFAGVKLDARRESETPVFTLILSLLGVFAAIYTVIKDFIRKE